MSKCQLKILKEGFKSQNNTYNLYKYKGEIQKHDKYGGERESPKLFEKVWTKGRDRKNI